MSQKNLIGLRCDSCGRAGYISHTNPKKQVARKIELQKFCNWCKKHTKHKEAKLPIKAVPKKKALAPKKVASVAKVEKLAKVAMIAKPKEIKK